MGGLFVSKMSCVLILPIALTLLAARLIDGSALLLQSGRVREVRSRGSQFLIFSGIGIGHVITVLIVIWASYGFRYSAFSPVMPNGSWTDETWEMLLEKRAPDAIFKQLDLTSTQQELVNKIFAREHTGPDHWSVGT